jgi:tetrapyrrole methylase family protein/MazG family protein/ATP diphosphatase
MSTPALEFARLVEIMSTLRGPHGCPWDREQTFESLSQFVLEEAYEVVDAIERGDQAALCEEIGDHIFEGVFLAQIAADLGAFSVADSLAAVSDKLVRRHPHVFQEDGRVHDERSQQRAPSADAALSRWDSQKAREKTALGELPHSLPALLRAYKLGKRASGVGFDWANPGDVVEKIEEEVAELREAVAQDPARLDRAEEEMGDLLFAIANLSRKLGIEPEAALRKANQKFERRFAAMEGKISDEGRTMQEMSLDELEAVWQQIK